MINKYKYFMDRWWIHIRYQNTDLDDEESKVHTVATVFVSVDPIKFRIQNPASTHLENRNKAKSKVTKQKTKSFQ